MNIKICPILSLHNFIGAKNDYIGTMCRTPPQAAAGGNTQGLNTICRRHLR